MFAILTLAACIVRPTTGTRTSGLGFDSGVTAPTPGVVAGAAVWSSVWLPAAGTAGFEVRVDGRVVRGEAFGPWRRFALEPSALGEHRVAVDGVESTFVTWPYGREEGFVPGDLGPATWRVAARGFDRSGVVPAALSPDLAVTLAPGPDGVAFRVVSLPEDAPGCALFEDVAQVSATGELTYRRATATRPIPGGEVTGRDLTARAGWSGAELGGVEFAGVIGTEPLAGLLGGSPCAYVAALGGACAPCADGEEGCLAVDARDLLLYRAGPDPGPLPACADAAGVAPSCACATGSALVPGLVVGLAALSLRRRRPPGYGDPGRRACGSSA